jgi:hypothetical protein
MTNLRTMISAVVLIANAAAGQAPVGNAVADSASAARAAWRRASAAIQSGDLNGARSEVERAATAWPTQEAYAWGRVALAARMSDTAGVLRALNAYAALGLGRDVRNEAATKAIAGAKSLASAIAKHDANRKALARSTVRVALTDSSFWPEGMDHDPRIGAFYVTSIAHRTIAEARVGTSGVRELLPRGSRELGAILGVRVDTALGVLWATTSGIPQMEGFVPGDTAIAALLRIRISDGTIERRWNLPVVPGGHVLGDLAVGPRGDIWMTDSQEPVLYRLAPGADSLVAIRHPAFRSLQGVAPVPDGRTLYIADYSHGILHMDIATGVVSRVGDAPGSVSLGCDGIVWHRGAIIAVQNGVAPARVMRFVLSTDGSRFTSASVLDRSPGVADEPTIGAMVGEEFVYVANSQWEKRPTGNSLREGAMLTPPRLLAVPVPRR